jgi:Zn-dependent metalloprotease
LVRAEGQKAAKDKAVNEAYDNVGHVLQMYKDLFNWQSIDNQNMHVVSSVHFGKNYENACK